MDRPLAAVDVVLVRPQGAINLGSCARLVANFGARRLVLVAPAVDHRGREARMFADRAQDVLAAAVVVPALADAVADAAYVLGTSSKIRAARDGAPLTPALARALGGAAPAPPPLALVFGNEAEGLTRDEAARCDRVVRLDAPGPYDSFNLSHAVAIALAAFAAAASVDDDGTPATPGTRADLERAWLRALEGAGYFSRAPRDAFAPRLHALLDRLALDEDDARLLRDMFAVLDAARAERR